MFCSNCGKEIDDNSKFCQFCGKNFENKENSNNNENTGCGKLIGAIIGGTVFLIFLTFLLNSNFSDYQGLSTTNEGRGRNLEVTESHSCNLEYGVKGICGTVKNNANHNIGYVQVEINLYDKNGNLLDSTIDNINNLEPNSTWKFEAPVINDKVSTYRIKNVSGL